MSDYAAIDAVNISTLKEMAKSPKHYRSILERPRKDTPALRLGTATHVAILEPKRFEEEYAVAPDFGDCRFKENRLERDNWRALNEGKQQVSADEYDRLKAMAWEVRTHPDAAKLLNYGTAEVAIEWTDPETRLRCKGRLDWVGENVVIGLKTTRNNDFRAFQSSVENYGYLLQWAWYQWGYQTAFGTLPSMYEIVVESDAPHDVVVYEVPQEVLDVGLEEARELLRSVADCKRAGYWPGRAPEIVRFRRAPWAGFDQEQEIDGEGLEIGDAL